MRVRTFGLSVLLLAGVAPLGVFAALSISRSERAAVDQVVTANRHLALSVARSIAAHLEARRELLRSLGVAALRPGASDDTAWLVDDYGLQYPHIGAVAVYDADGSLRAGVAAPPDYAPLIARALAGTPTSALAAVDTGHGHVLGSSQYVVEPLVLVGKQIGAIAARIDLVDVWEPVHSIRVGERGYARLVTTDGTMLAHGDPEERRDVFSGGGGLGARARAIARDGGVVTNTQGIDVVATAAEIPGLDWIVIVEQPVAEAFALARAMRRDLYWLGTIAIALVVILGVASGRTLVASLERLRKHTVVLASGALHARAGSDGPIAEVRALATALDEMAGSIERLHAETRVRERLSTFARVAAGLAHDLRLPIETVRAACTEYAANPSDPDSRELFEFMRVKELPRLKRYMDDLQRLAQEGDVPLQRATIDLGALASEVAADLDATPKWQGVSFTTDARPCWLDVDRSLLRRALYNLAANGADACLTNGPGGQVRIEVEPSSDGDHVELRVSDTGAGLEPDALERLLSGDFQSNKRSSGVGLGFGVARYVAHAHGGEITGTSEVGRGSKFSLRIPATQSQP